MKKHELLFSLLRIPLDFFSMYIGFYISKNIRLITDWIPGVTLPIQTIDNSSLATFAFFWASLYVTLFASHKLYTLNISNSKIWEILDIIRYSIYWFLFFSVWVYLWNGIIYSGVEIPRLIILFSVIIWSLWSIFTRIIINTLQAFLLKKNVIQKRNILLISNVSPEKLKPIVQDIQLSQVYNIIWYANSKKIEKYKHAYISSIDEIEQLLQTHSCDEILYIDSDFSKTQLYTIWEYARIYGIRYRYITNNFDITKTNTHLSFINQTPVIELLNTPLENWWRIGKRVFDIIFSLSVLTFWFPFFIIIALIIKIEDSSGPIIYKNLRIWQNWKIFNCYKFRYIKWEYCVKESYGVDNNDDPAIKYEQELITKVSSRDGPLYKIKQDPRKTKFWSFLEKYSLDEFPQFINVLKWEMSIIGPRPHQPREVQKYEKYQKRLLTIKPWITWMAQVNWREQNNFVKEAKLDIFYIENWSFLLDLKILLKTLSTILTRK